MSARQLTAEDIDRQFEEMTPEEAALFLAQLLEGMG
jgi:hypothetical protein